YYYFVQITTALILMLAANTGFTGFPRLASVLANDRFMPRHFADVGSRLAFNTGILALAVVAGGILAAFGGSVNALVPLYTIGVFLAFTLSQSGLVRRWWRLRNSGWRLSVVINSLDVVESPYRSLMAPLLKYIDAIDKSDDRPITVVLSEFVPRHWWEWLLHSQTAMRLKASLLFRPNTIVIDVPYHFQDTADLTSR